MIDRRTFLAAAGGAALLPMAAARAQSQSTRVRTQDATDIHVKEWNRSRRPVILTHACLLSADIWDHQAVAVSNAGYRVVSYDRRGLGRSGKPSSGYDFDIFADDLMAVIGAMELSDATLVG